MKLSRISLWSLTLAGFMPAVRAESWNQFPESGPETTLDSLWASAAYVQTLVEASSAQIDLSRFRQKGPSRLWAAALGSFGDAGVRNKQPSFDYSAAGYALGYDYGVHGEKSGSLLGLSFGQLFGHQNIQEMPDYPDGPLEGDRFRQSSWTPVFRKNSSIRSPSNVKNASKRFPSSMAGSQNRSSCHMRS